MMYSISFFKTTSPASALLDDVLDGLLSWVREVLPLRPSVLVVRLQEELRLAVREVRHLVPSEQQAFWVHHHSWRLILVVAQQGPDSRRTQLISALFG